MRNVLHIFVIREQYRTVSLRDPGLSLLTFRRRLKTYLFNPPGYLSS